MGTRAAITGKSRGWVNSSTDMKTLRPLLLACSNAALYLNACAMVATGLLLELRLDDDEGPSRLLGLDRDDWGELHFGIALGFAGLALVHLILHWAWIRASVARMRALTVAVLVVGAVSIAALLLWPAGAGGEGRAQSGTSAGHERDD
jgi:hypothetical protein